MTAIVGLYFVSECCVVFFCLPQRFFYLSRIRLFVEKTEIVVGCGKQRQHRRRQNVSPPPPVGGVMFDPYLSVC